MLKEVERQLVLPKEREIFYRADVVILGSGIMGLLLANKLADLDQAVVLIESKPKIAAGASIKNHGWLHKGTVHALSVENIEESHRVVQKIVYGHEYLRNYASEAIEDPFEPIFIGTESQELAERAVSAWENLGIDYEPYSWDRFINLEPNISLEKKLYIFRASDLLINNRILFQKLLTEIKRKGVLILEDSTYETEDIDRMHVQSRNRDAVITSKNFIYCVGANIGEEYKRLTGEELDISFWKSHLIFLPRFSSYSLVCLDKGAPIIVNHKDTSIVNKGYDEVLVSFPDQSVDEDKVVEAFEAARLFYPGIESLKGFVSAVACPKPTIKIPGSQRHSVDSQIFEPFPNHYFILPGKMTEAPYVADDFIQRIYSKLDFGEITQRPLDRPDARRDSNLRIKAAGL